MDVGIVMLFCVLISNEKNRGQSQIKMMIFKFSALLLVIFLVHSMTRLANFIVLPTHTQFFYKLTARVYKSKLAFGIAPNSV